MKKQEARILFREKRKELGEAQRLKYDDLMLIQFQTLVLPHINHLLSYWPIDENHEPDTHLFGEYLAFRNPAMKILYPHADFENNIMEAIEPEADTPFIKNEYNIHEPMNGVVTDAGLLDMIFIPLLAFDEKGIRVGYGKGFYDKYLQHCRPDCIKIGFCYFEALDRIEGTHDFDVPLDICVTPNKVYVF
jgi:5-formyltetrahydrofolate cyclo-ligase